MCTKQEEQTAYGTKPANSNNVNVTINKQHQTRCSASNLCASENHSVDFRIQTNIEFISYKKIKCCLFINLLISVICISGSLLIIYKLYAELLQVQNQIFVLNARLSTLSDSCAQSSLNVNAVTEEAQYVESVQDVEAQNKDEMIGTQDGNYEFVLTNSTETNLNRLRRANRRKKEKNARRKVKSSGALAAHFKGSLPEIHIRDQGLVGPWYPDSLVSREYKFPKFHLTEGKCSIEVTEPALYLIYAQVYYITSSAVNSYTVYVRSEGNSENHVIAKCSAIGPNSSHVSEISCFTSTVYSLSRNDRIFIQQTEKNRTIILRDGHSFFGLVRLNNSRRTKS